MALSADLRAFTHSNVLLGGTQSLSIGFQAKLLLGWHQSRNTQGSAAGPVQISFGAAASGPTQKSVAISVDPASSFDNRATSDSDSSNFSKEIIEGTFGSPLTSGSWAISSIDATSYSVATTDQGSANQGVQVLALGGDAISNVAMGTLAFPNSTSTATLSGLSFAPDALLFFAPSFYGGFLFGAACREGSPNQACCAGGQPYNSATSVYSYSKSGRCFAYGLGSTIAGSGIIQSWTGDGAAISWTKHGAASSAVTANYVAIKMARGFGVRLFSGNTTTGTGALSFTNNSGLTPLAGMAFSACKPESSGETADVNLELSLGAFNGTTQFASSYISRDTGGSSIDCGMALRADSVYSNMVNTATPATLEGRMSVTGASPNTLSLNMDDGDPAGAFVWSLVFGTTASVRGAPIFF